jgi:sugar phosphate isomerase/epimerase
MHDNHTLPYFGAVYEWDSHMGEYTGGVNWARLMQTLAAIGYSGDFTFEADNFFRKLPAENALDASRFMCDVGRYIISFYEEAKGGAAK